MVSSHGATATKACRQMLVAYTDKKHTPYTHHFKTPTTHAKAQTGTVWRDAPDAAASGVFRYASPFQPTLSAVRDDGGSVRSVVLSCGRRRHHTAGVVVSLFVGSADHRDDDLAARTKWSGRASAAPVRPPRMAGISDRYRTGTSRTTQEELGRDP